MHRTTGDANVANLFDEGDPEEPRQPTQIDASWLNDVQEEICNAIEEAGITLVEGTQDQLIDAIPVITQQFTITRTSPSSFANSWVDGGVPAKYYKDSAGLVHLEGSVTHPSDGNSVEIFTLPTGFRPPAERFFAIPTFASMQNAYVKVQADGVVKMVTTSGAAARTVLLDAVAFHP